MKRKQLLTVAVLGFMLGSTTAALAADVHYVSVTGSKGTTAEPTDVNYNNDGAQAANTIVIGEGTTSKSVGAIAIGTDLTVGISQQAQRAIVIGNNSTARTSDNIVLGTEAVGDAIRGVTIGTRAKSSSMDGIVIGTDAKTVSGSGSIALGNKATSGGTSVVVGDNAVASFSSVAIGEGAKVDNLDYVANATSTFGTAVGNSATIGKNSASSTVIGALASVADNAKQSTVVGLMAKSTATNATAVGVRSTVDSKSGSALGVSATIGANADLSTALGAGSSVGAGAKESTVVGVGSSSTAADGTAVGFKSATNGASGTAVGTSATVNTDGGTALGHSSSIGTGSLLSTAVGGSASVAKSAGLSVVVGSNSTAEKQDSTVLGVMASSKAVGGTALGRASQVNASKGTAIGRSANVTADGGVALGANSLADRAAGTIGYDPSTGAAYAGGDSLTWKATSGAVSVGSTEDNKTRQITNLAAGTEDTDAVNVAQLKNIGLRLAGDEATKGSVILAKDTLSILGDGKNIKTKVDGQKVTVSISDTPTFESVTANSFKVGDKTYLDTNGLNANSQVISNVAAGVKTTDAVNVGQLTPVKEAVAAVQGDVKSVQGDVKNLQGDMKSVQGDVKSLQGDVKDIQGDMKNMQSGMQANLDKMGNELRKDMFEGDAQAAALSALKPLAYDAAEPTQIMAGYGYYRGHSAFALGLAHYSSDSVLMHGGVSLVGGGSNMMANAGVTWKVGSGAKVATTQSTKLQEELAAAKAKNEVLEKRLDSQEEMIKALQEEMKALKAK